jgi:hypothetical protein
MDLSERSHASGHGKTQPRSHRENKLPLPYSSDWLVPLKTIAGGPVALNTEAFCLSATSHAARQH